MKKNDVSIVLTAAIVYGGRVRRAGDVIECTNVQARHLLDRGRGKLATDWAVSYDAPDQEKPLADHTVAELRAIADEYELDGIASMKKAELIEAIEAVEAEGADDDAAEADNTEE